MPFLIKVFRSPVPALPAETGKTIQADMGTVKTLSA